MSKLPPIPPENRSHSEIPAKKGAAADRHPKEKREIDPDKQGQQANTKQNTTNQGYQQDR
jgi:hypothetical protein